MEDGLRQIFGFRERFATNIKIIGKSDVMKIIDEAVQKRIKELITVLSGLGLVVALMYFSKIGCPIKWFTGISCAGCGMTRAILHAVRFQFRAAFACHPLFFILPFIPVYYIFKDKLPEKVQKVLLWAVVLAFTAVYIVRLLDPSDTIVRINLKEGIPGRMVRYFQQ